MGVVYSGDTYVETLPPAVSGASTPGGGAGTWWAQAKQTCDYFGGDPPPGFWPNAKDRVDAGGIWPTGYEGFYWPGLQTGGWDLVAGSGLPMPDPPRVETLTYGTPHYGYTNYGNVGRYTFNDELWSIWTYYNIQFYRYLAMGSLSLPGSREVDLYWKRSIALSAGGEYVPQGTDEDWSFIETSAGVGGYDVPVVPSTVDLSLHVGANAARSAGTLDCYVAWVPKNGAAVSYAWADATPGSPWVLAGSMGYGTAGGWQTISLNLSGLGANSGSGYGLNEDYMIGLVFLTRGTWTDPADSVENGPYTDVIGWDQVRVMFHYATGAVKYRTVGPEIPANNATLTPDVFIGGWEDVSASGYTLNSVIASDPPDIVQTTPWPFAPYTSYDIIAMARPDGRSGGELNLVLLRGIGGGAYALAIGKIHVSQTGAFTTELMTLNATTLRVGASPHLPYLFGGNETSQILCMDNSGAAALLDTNTGAVTSVSGITLTGSGSNWMGGPATFTQGSSYLVIRYHWQSGQNDDDNFMQRYTISGGVASASGPLMSVPHASSALHPNDYLYDLMPGDVWDDGDWTAAFTYLWNDDLPIRNGSLLLHLFDGTSPTPAHAFELYRGPDGDNPEYSVGNNDRVPASFSRTSSGYALEYLRISARPVGTSDYWPWYSIARRTFNPTTGLLGPEIFVADTADTGDASAFRRADSGAVLEQLYAFILNASPSATGVSQRLLIETGTAEGVQTLLPRDAGDWAWNMLWAGLWHADGRGRLYFKYRWPG